MPDAEGPAQRSDVERAASAEAASTAGGGAGRDRPADEQPGAAPLAVPQRYLIRQDDGPYLTCVAAQNIAARIERGKTVPAAAAKRAAERTIFLDGAAQAEPFLEVQDQIYNLDHHEGCVRAFTLATCEQAMVLVRKGLDLHAGEWTLRANEPDLDTVLAIWILLNHQRLGDEDASVRRAVMPIVRLEGVIDAHGLGLTELCAFPDDLLQETERTIEGIRTLELELKQQGRWASSDVLAYTAQVLHAIDGVVLSPEHVDDTWAVEELARVAVTDDRTAIVCRSEAGIYEVENALRKQHGARVGLIALGKDAKTYTLRQVDAFLPVSLEEVYRRLNTFDPVVSRSNRWGGSTDIGGSPRGTGTALSPQRIAAVLRWVYRGPTSWHRAAAVGLGLATALGFCVVALAIAGLVGWARPEDALAAGTHLPIALLVGRHWYAGFLLTATVLAFGAHTLHNRRVYGATLPTGWSWLWLVPIAALCGAMGGTWLAPGWLGRGTPAVTAALLLPVAGELLFRGLVHGRFSGGFRVALGEKKWRPSLPVWLAALLSAAVVAFVTVSGLAAWGGFAAVWRIALALLGAGGLGLACGLARERSESVGPAVLLHVLAAVVAAYASLVRVP